MTDDDDVHGAMMIIAGMREQLEATIEQARERHRPLVDEVNAILSSAGSQKRITSDDFCVTNVLWALLPVIQRLVDRTNN